MTRQFKPIKFDKFQITFTNPLSCNTVLFKVQYNNVKILFFPKQREVRKLLAEGKISTYEKGEIVVKLMEHEGATEEEALIAATNCDNIEAAKNYLQQECELCMNIMKIVEVKTKEHKKVEAERVGAKNVFAVIGM